jgi:hypothetical protein
MRERTDRRESYDQDDQYDEYGDQPSYRDEVRGGRRDPRATAPAKGRSSRVPIAIAAVLAVAAAGTIAVVESGVLKKKDPAPLGGGPLAMLPPSSSAATNSSSAGAAPSTASSTAAQASAGLTAPIVAANVGALYGIAEQALDPQGSPSAKVTATLPALFASTSALHAYWGTGTKPQAATTCGVKAPTVSVIEAPRPSDGSGAIVRVDLFQKGKPGPKAVDVAVDANGKIVGMHCVTAAAPAYPGLAFVLDTYGKGPVSVPNIKATGYAPASQDAPSLPTDADWNTCAQFSPDTWVFYAPLATSAGSAWRFSYDQVDVPLVADLFVDPASGKAQRVVCEGLPAIPAPDLAAAGKTSQTHPVDPAGDLMEHLVQGYAQERALVSAGAKPTEEMAPYFASDSAFQAALTGSGKIPFLCTDKNPYDVTETSAGTVTGTTEAVAVTIMGAPTDGNPEDAPVIGKATYTLDLTTMKITGVACH